MAFNARSANRIGESKYAVVGNTETGITAHAGGGQDDAYLLRAQLSIIETAASVNDSVKLPRISTTPDLLGSLNSVMTVSNQTAHSVQVFGSGPDTIDGENAGAGVALPPGFTATFFTSNFTTPFDQSAGTGSWVSTIAAGGGGAGSLTIAASPIVSGHSGRILFEGDGNVLQEHTALRWNQSLGYLGIWREPACELNVDGLVRIENTILPAISLQFWHGASEGGLIQFLTADAYGFGNGAMLCGLGFSNATWGWTEDHIIVNGGCFLGFTSSNIQSDPTSDASISRLDVDHLQTGLLTIKRANEIWTDLGSGTTFAIDFAVGGTFRINPTNNFTVTFANLPLAGSSARVVIEVDSASGFTGTYPGGFIWSGGSEPAWSANVDLATIYVSGDHSTYFGMQSFAG